MRRLLIAFAALSVPASAWAAVLPRPGLADRHIQTADYDPDQVVLLQGVLGYQLMLEFSPDERLESVSIGDSLGWQVTPNHNANILFLKPLAQNALTNMSVVTNQRRYAFDMRVMAKGASTADAPYVVRFSYPRVEVAVAEPPPPEPPPAELNAAYVVTGAPENRPLKVFDDGKMTYFSWDAQASAPAIFAVSAEGKESLVNYDVRDGYTVVQQLAPRFVLRHGKRVATVVNQGFVGPTAENTRRGR
jgi:type IV secretion system protein VirB9